MNGAGGSPEAFTLAVTLAKSTPRIQVGKVFHDIARIDQAPLQRSRRLDH